MHKKRFRLLIEGIAIITVVISIGVTMHHKSYCPCGNYSLQPHAVDVNGLII